MRRKLLIYTWVLAGAMMCAPVATAQAPKLKDAVTLAGANKTNDTIDIQAAPGPFSRGLDFYVSATLDPSPSAGRLAVTSLKATAAPGDVVTVKAAVASGGAGGSDGAPFEISLTSADRLRITIEADALRAGAIYKSRIILSALKETREWELTVTTNAKAVIAVDPIPSQQFERSLGAVWCSWFGCSAPIGEFKFSFRNKTPFGAVTGLQARFEPSLTTASKELRSTFSIDSFSFRTWSNPLPYVQQTSTPTANQVRSTASDAAETPASSCDAPGPMVPIPSLDKPAWIAACVYGLQPGEYSGALRILANESADDAADSRLALVINVRDPRAIPIAVLIIGSAIGWFTTKYLTAARKARDMGRVVAQLRDRADHLSRGKTGRLGWGFSDEAVSTGLMRVRVALNRLTTLTKDGMAMLVEETELTRIKDDAEMRLSKLEALRDLRVQVEANSQILPTIQRFVGRLLRDCSGLLDAPLFGATQQATFGERLEEIKKWASNDARAATYRAALVKRRNDEEGLVHPKDFAAGHQARIKELVDAWPKKEHIDDQTADSTLHEFDKQFEMLALLNRDRKADWANDLVEGSKDRTLNELFALVDKAFWQMLQQTESKGFRINADRLNVECYDLIRFTLSHPTIIPTRLLVHPLHFVWTIHAPNETRVVETEDLTLVQYFSEPGTATVSVELRWVGQQPIAVADTASVTVAINPDYGGVQIFTQGGGPEYIAIAIAMAFAVVTAMQSQYDSSFGSASQYLALFIWAAGAATGGNILKQLGTNNSPGGQTEAALPANG